VNVRLLAPAAAELDEARAWYAAQAPGLDRRFIHELISAGKRIVERPHAWPVLGDGVRRFRLGRFPYGLIYVVKGDEIVVLAVAHLHRKPNYWRGRQSGTIYNGPRRPVALEPFRVWDAGASVAA
jgi:plasmid stabilization system protein ParE